MLEEQLKVIYLSIDLIRISTFSILDDTVTFEIHFNDGVQKQVYKTTSIEDARELAEAIVTDLVRMEENINMEFDGETMVGNVHVILRNYDDLVSKMSDYLRIVRAKMTGLKRTKIAEGYVTHMNDLSRAELRLNARYS